MYFRKAKSSDLEVLNTISLKSKKHWGYPDEWITHWLEDLLLTPEKLAQQSILVAETKEEITGFCSITEEEESYEVLHLWLLPEYIGQGYGKQLLNNAVEEFTKADKPIIVEADPHAEPFYNSQGFVTYDKTESYPPGRFLPVMKRNSLSD